MARLRNNPSNWLVAYEYSYMWEQRRWKVWRPDKYNAELISFNSPAEAHNWINRKVMVEEREIRRNFQVLDNEEFTRLYGVLTK